MVSWPRRVSRSSNAGAWAPLSGSTRALTADWPVAVSAVTWSPRSTASPGYIYEMGAHHVSEPNIHSVEFWKNAYLDEVQARQSDADNRDTVVDAALAFIPYWNSDLARRRPLALALGEALDTWQRA